MPRDISDVYCQPWSGGGGPAGRPVGPVRGPRRVRQRQQGRAALGHDGSLILLARVTMQIIDKIQCHHPSGMKDEQYHDLSLKVLLITNI